MEKVIEVKESRDISTVIVKTTNGNLLNPVHLYPLEANLDPESRKASKVKQSDPISPQEIEKAEKQTQMINQLETAYKPLFEENIELKKDIKRMQNEIEISTQKFDQPVNQISLVQELQEFYDEIKSSSQSYIEKSEDPRGSKVMQKLDEHRTYEYDSQSEKPTSTPSAAAGASGRKLLPAFSPFKEKSTIQETSQKNHT
uniref:Uncharacterized protein n=1 Tax=Panagrolaimus sp. PS1159 TaxID=55785 RepID=A0AC35FUU4_9BILA